MEWLKSIAGNASKPVDGPQQPQQQQQTTTPGGGSGGDGKGQEHSAATPVYSLASTGPLQQPFWDALTPSTCQNILIAGCGGGYDVFSGIPLFFALHKMGKTVSLANISFTTSLQTVTGKRYTEHCVAVTADSVRSDERNWKIETENYFPELFLSKWFREKEGMEVPIYSFAARGVKKVSAVYQALATELELDCIILADGGTDSLMTGDEEGLGTPMEDMTSIAAVSNIKSDRLTQKFLVCLGYGVDAFHGVCHNHVLENVAALSRAGGFYGTFSLLPQHPEAQKFIDAYTNCQPMNSIVCASVVSAIQGNFGNYHHPATACRTKGGPLFINPLMSMYWCFDFDAVIKQIKYLSHIHDTNNASEVQSAIMGWHYSTWRDDKGKFIGRVTTPFPH
eukprot:TRINITY_DN2777_c2_g1_i1.p1 TRINITY_DN2777_c2_g1~~TRINITY_DN2777_c2_g1_i1.p1  ORF type:complete len:394 (+),score=72.38 TRINITY_DN2777_c2_g1_i1:2-1183(+)